MEIDDLDVPVIKKACSTTFSRLQAVPKHQRKNSIDKDFFLDKEFLSRPDVGGNRGKSFDMSHMESPVKSEIMENLRESVFGWIVSADPKFDQFYDIDFMTEIGRATDDFPMFRRLLKG